MNRPRPEKEAQTLGELGVTRWLAKFPNWRGALKATIADDEPMSHLEQVHRSVAIVHKGMKDGSKKLDRYINVKKKKSSWNTLVYGAPTPWDDRYPETMLRFFAQKNASKEKRGPPHESLVALVVRITPTRPRVPRAVGPWTP
jgi:hypothetical protein